jgi:hypothetical protein
MRPDGLLEGVAQEGTAALPDRRALRNGLQRQNPESRAEDSRFNRTLTFILSLTGRGKDPGSFAALRMTQKSKAARVSMTRAPPCDWQETTAAAAAGVIYRLS